MIKLNKKAIEDAGTSNNGKNESIKLLDSFRLSDKIKLLYRYLRLNKEGKKFVRTAINSAFICKQTLMLKNQ